MFSLPLLQTMGLNTNKCHTKTFVGVRRDCGCTHSGVCALKKATQRRFVMFVALPVTKALSKTTSSAQNGTDPFRLYPWTWMRLIAPTMTIWDII